MKKKTTLTLPSLSVVTKKANDYCEICHAVVAPGDPARILIRSSDNFIHAHCLAYHLLNNGLSGVKREVSGVFKPLFDYNYNNIRQRVSLEEILPAVEKNISFIAEDKRAVVLNSLHQYCSEVLKISSEN